MVTPHLRAGLEVVRQRVSSDFLAFMTMRTLNFTLTEEMSRKVPARYSRPTSSATYNVAVDSVALTSIQRKGFTIFEAAGTSPTGARRSKIGKTGFTHLEKTIAVHMKSGLDEGAAACKACVCVAYFLIQNTFIPKLHIAESKGTIST
jgi:hypothetical protein